MNRDTNMLAPVVAEVCGALIKAAAQQGIRLMVTSTLRTQAEQRALYAQGRRPLDEVNSLRRMAGMYVIKERANRVVTGARISMHQFGCAFDVAVVNKGVAVWDASADLNANGMPEYEEIGLIGESLGLTWGGRFHRRDLCHFEYTDGLSTEELIAGMRPGSIETDVLDVQKKKEDEDMDKAKAGMKSTEFYLALLGAVLPVLNTHLGMQIPVSGVMSISGVVISYILARTVIKRG